MRAREAPPPEEVPWDFPLDDKSRRAPSVSCKFKGGFGGWVIEPKRKNALRRFHEIFFLMVGQGDRGPYEN